MIVLNGEPFVRYNLRSLYPFAHQIIVVEGTAPDATGIASPSGHSTDGTLETLRDFQVNEDPEDKFIILTAEDAGYPNGFWPGEKDEQSQAYASCATGNYLWQVDVDEFYMADDIITILEMLQKAPSITAISFPQITFWGHFDYLTDGWYLRRDWCAKGINRIFKWGPGYSYITHRPTAVQNERAENLHNIYWVDGNQLKELGIFIYHYSLLFPKQVIEKCEYYSQAKWAKSNRAQQWAQESFMKLEKPFRVHNVYDHPSWLERYHGRHPFQIDAMRQDIADARLLIGMRQNEDVERLLKSPIYALGRSFLKAWDGVDRRIQPIGQSICNRSK